MVGPPWDLPSARSPGSPGDAPSCDPGGHSGAVAESCLRSGSSAERGRGTSCATCLVRGDGSATSRLACAQLCDGDRGCGQRRLGWIRWRARRGALVDGCAVFWVRGGPRDTPRGFPARRHRGADLALPRPRKRLRPATLRARRADGDARRSRRRPGRIPLRPDQRTPACAVRPAGITGRQRHAGRLVRGPRRAPRPRVLLAPDRARAHRSPALRTAARQHQPLRLLEHATRTTHRDKARR